MELCKGVSVKDWQRLRARLDGEERAWTEAISVFERRMKERFFRCIDVLLDSDIQNRTTERVVPGFAIMALCCLLIETLQSFYEGGNVNEIPTTACTFPTGRCAMVPSTSRAFKDFLRKSPHFNVDFRNSEIRGDFSHDVRNALLHEAETRRGWLIEKSKPRDRMLSGRHGYYVLNRTKFYRALVAEFQDYLDRLRNPQNKSARENFIRRMDLLCLTEPEIPKPDEERTGSTPA